MSMVLLISTPAFAQGDLDGGDMGGGGEVDMADVDAGGGGMPDGQIQAGLNVGGAAPLGDLGDKVGFGIGFAGWGGYAMDVASFYLVPRAKFGFTKYLGKEVAPGSDVSGNAITFLVGTKAGYQIDNMVPYINFGLGFGRVAGSGGGDSMSESGFGVEFGAGVDYWLDGWAIGGFLDYGIIMVESAGPGPGSASSVSFGAAGTAAF